ncbi:MAG: hypothetical protein H7A32_01320 [Deltaproteobacteria bacterium]|nr:hypothetical protein [Deltaproteobacteria bacterium]
MTTHANGGVSVRMNSTNLASFPQEISEDICLDASLETSITNSNFNSNQNTLQNKSTTEHLVVATQYLLGLADDAWKSFNKIPDPQIKMHVVTAGAEKLRAAKEKIKSTSKKTEEATLSWDTAPWYHKAWMLPVGLLGAIACGGTSEKESATDGEDTGNMTMCENEGLESECTVTVLPNGDIPVKVWVDGAEIPIVPLEMNNSSLYENVCAAGGYYLYEYPDPQEQEILMTLSTGIWFLSKWSLFDSLENPRVVCDGGTREILDSASMDVQNIDEEWQVQRVYDLLSAQLGQEISLWDEGTIDDQRFSYSFSDQDQKIGLGIYHRGKDALEYLWLNDAPTSEAIASVFTNAEQDYLLLEVRAEDSHEYQGETYSSNRVSEYYTFDFSDKSQPQALGKIKVPQANIYDEMTLDGHLWSELSEMTLRSSQDPLIVGDEIWILHYPELDPYLYPELENMGIAGQSGRATLSRFNLADGEALGDTELQMYTPSKAKAIAGTEYVAVYGYPKMVNQEYTPTILWVNANDPVNVSNLQSIDNPQIFEGIYSTPQFSKNGHSMLLLTDVTDESYAEKFFRYANGHYVEESVPSRLPQVETEFSYTYQELPQVGVRKFPGNEILKDSNSERINESLTHRSLYSGKNRDYVWVDTEQGLGFYFRLDEEEPCYNFYVGGEGDFEFSCPLEVGAALYEQNNEQGQDKLWMGYGDRVLRLEGSELP